MKHVIYTLLFATVGGALTFGAASSLTVNSQELGSGGAEIASCDPDGVNVTYDLLDTDPTVISAFSVEGIALPNCVGRKLHWALLGKDAAGKEIVLTSGRVDVDAAVETFGPLKIKVEDLARISITLAG